jgi:hypothetical protein
LTGVKVEMAFTTYDEAVAAATPDEMVCGTLLKDGEPSYFLMPRGIDDEAVRDRAFQIREGRSMGEYEKFLLAHVEATRGH